MARFSASTDWGGDYSYLLHSIEGRLSSQIPSSEQQSVLSQDDYLSSLSTTRKRLRLSDALPVEEPSPEKLLSPQALGSTREQSAPSRGYVFKLENAIEELKLSNEELKDKIDSSKHELKHVSEKYIRQLTFVESEVLRLQKALEQKNEKYYDEKKKWQARIRGLESQVEKLSDNLVSKPQGSTGSSAVGSQKENSNSNLLVAELKEKYAKLQKDFDSSTLESSNKIKSYEEKMKHLQAESTKLRELKEENSALLKLRDEQEASIAELRRSLLVAESKSQSLERDNLNVKLESQSLESKLQLSLHQSKLYEGEVKSMRSLLASYEAEFKIGRPDISKMTKLREETISKLRSELDLVRQEASFISSKAFAMSDKTGPAPLAEEQIEKVAALTSEVEKYKALYEALQTYTRTDVLPGHTKVLHMAANPYSEALHQRDGPQQSEVPSKRSTIPLEELKHLRREVRELSCMANKGAVSESSGLQAHIFDGSPEPSVSNTNNHNSTGALDSNKLNQRLKEMFKDRITSFREAVYLLTGYKVDLYAADTSGSDIKRLRLRSMYAESPEDSLIFQWRDETLELLETPFASRLDPKFFSYLNSSNSVPAFLANLTMELFENQTFQG